MLNLVCEHWATKNNLVGSDCNLDFKVVDGSLKSLKTKVYNVPIKARSGKIKLVKAYGFHSLGANVSCLNKDILNHVVK